MAKFEIEWGDGKVEVVEQSDCHSPLEYINCRFGSKATRDSLPARVTQLTDIPAEVVVEKSKKATKK